MSAMLLLQYALQIPLKAAESISGIMETVYCFFPPLPCTSNSDAGPGQKEINMVLNYISVCCSAFSSVKCN